METELIIILFFIGTIAIASVFLEFLSKSGAIAAFLTGVFVVLGFGLKGLILMGLFYLTSSLLSKYKRKQKTFLDEFHEKGSARDWAQVAANGGTAALAGAANFVFPDPAWLFAFAISLASANADTWASELGVLSSKPPFSVKNFRRVPPGTSGAISGFGTLASAAGSTLIGISACLLFWIDWEWAAFISLFGFAGTMADTYLGAYSQAVYQCVVCGKHTEKTSHCSKRAERLSGRKWMNNDAVNFLSGFTVSLLGMVLYMMIIQS